MLSPRKLSQVLVTFPLVVPTDAVSYWGCSHSGQIIDCNCGVISLVEEELMMIWRLVLEWIINEIVHPHCIPIPWSCPPCGGWAAPTKPSINHNLTQRHYSSLPQAIVCSIVSSAPWVTSPYLNDIVCWSTIICCLVHHTRPEEMDTNSIWNQWKKDSMVSCVAGRTVNPEK